MIKNKKGFTLIELLVALAIISVILFAFFRVLNSTIKVNTKNDRDIKALNLCQSEVEKIRSQIKQNDEYISISTADKVKEIKIHRKNDDKNIRWVNSEENVKEEIYIIDTGEYEDNIAQDENGIKNNNKLKYKKEYSDGNIYNISLGIKREKKDLEKNIYLYDIDISAELEDTYFSKKKSDLSTSILAKEDIVVSEEDGGIPEPPPEFKSGVNFFRVRTSSLIFGKNREDKWTTRTLHNNITPSSKIPPENKHKIKLEIELKKDNMLVDVYATLNGNRIKLPDEYSVPKYNISDIKIDPNSTGGKNSFVIEELSIKHFVDNEEKDSYIVDKIVGEDYVVGKDIYEYKLTSVKDTDRKIIIEFLYYYKDDSATVDFLFGKRGE